MIKEVKNRQRKLCFEKRRALTEEERKTFSEEICRKVAELPEFKNAKTVFSYLFIRHIASLPFNPLSDHLLYRQFENVCILRKDD